MFINKITAFQKQTYYPVRGIEPEDPDWQSEILTTILQKISVEQYLLQFISWGNLIIH